MQETIKNETLKKETLKNELKSLPNSPGVYQYFDAAGKLLYVGKAKVLKNRVKSYFSFTPTLAPSPRLSPRIAKMIAEAVHIEWIETSSESDALILENSFIKQLRPKYNILLRDDKTYPYIYVDFSEPYPRPVITRKLIKGAKIRYFGPFYKGAKDILEAIYEEFALVQKKGCLKEKKACLFAQINRCLAPCVGGVSQEEYQVVLGDALKALKNPTSLIPRLEQKMLFHATHENFEQAAHLRDQIETIKSISVKVEIDLAKFEDFEIFSVASASGFFCALRLSVREGKVAYATHSITQAPKIAQNSDESIINELYKQSILAAFPSSLPLACSQIFTSDDFEDSRLCEQVLQTRHSRKFSIKTPKIGEKKALANIAHKNALELIKKHINTHKYSLLEDIQNYFGLNNLPLKIECFDNSMLFGEAKVGAMIAWQANSSEKGSEFYKEGYRHMHLSSSNDYEQMKEMLTARALRFESASPPDLWLIDGGKALYDLACAVLASSGANVDVLAIAKEKIDAKAHRAKGSALDKIHCELGEMKLSPNDAKLQFLQRLRDEAHRFAISFHRKTRDKTNLAKSELANLGLSAGAIKKLLDYYGSFEAIKAASNDEIARVAGKQAAKKLAEC